MVITYLLELVDLQLTWCRRHGEMAIELANEVVWKFRYKQLGVCFHTNCSARRLIPAKEEKRV